MSSLRMRWRSNAAKAGVEYEKKEESPRPPKKSNLKKNVTSLRRRKIESWPNEERNMFARCPNCGSKLNH